MSVIFSSVITAAEKQMFIEKLSNFTVSSDRCKTWVGTINKDGYGVIRLMFRNHRRRVTVHRLQYFLQNNCMPLSPQLHVSHICHNRLCVKIQHLSLEPCKVNSDRKRCNLDKACTGHRGFANCVF